MTEAEYRALTLAEMKKKRWRLTRDVTTFGGMTATAGTEVRIVGKRSGVEVETETCPHCGVRFRCRKVSPGGVREITPVEGLTRTPYGPNNPDGPRRPGVNRAGPLTSRPDV